MPRARGTTTLLICDNASWHISRQVTGWIRERTRQVKHQGRVNGHSYLTVYERRPNQIRELRVDRIVPESWRLLPRVVGQTAGPPNVVVQFRLAAGPASGGLQYSVFECYLDKKQILLLRTRLLKLVKEQEDNIRIYDLCDGCERRVESIGREGPREEEVYIV